MLHFWYMYILYDLIVPQIVSSIILIIYTQNLFDFIGYEWTFVIIGFLCILSKLQKYCLNYLSMFFKLYDSRRCYFVLLQ